MLQATDTSCKRSKERVLSSHIQAIFDLALPGKAKVTITSVCETRYTNKLDVSYEV